MYPGRTRRARNSRSIQLANMGNCVLTTGSPAGQPVGVVMYPPRQWSWRHQRQGETRHRVIATWMRSGLPT